MRTTTAKTGSNSSAQQQRGRSQSSIDPHANLGMARRSHRARGCRTSNVSMEEKDKNERESTKEKKKRQQSYGNNSPSTPSVSTGISSQASSISNLMSGPQQVLLSRHPVSEKSNIPQTVQVLNNFKSQVGNSIPPNTLGATLDPSIFRRRSISDVIRKTSGISLFSTSPAISDILPSPEQPESQDEPSIITTTTNSAMGSPMSISRLSKGSIRSNRIVLAGMVGAGGAGGQPVAPTKRSSLATGESQCPSPSTSVSTGTGPAAALPRGSVHSLQYSQSGRFASLIFYAIILLIRNF